MYTYSLLEKGCYYLIQEKQDSPISLIEISMKTERCMFISIHGDTESSAWKRHTDTIFDIIELLGEEEVKAWESLYMNIEDTFNTGEED